ncbi:MAG TPA: ankyrin repeat domain-containing protein [Kofleriaceae bacterium]|nr:ankyrin repeat domain-containing protein [Kofleriaceae bacterium]
MRPAVAACLLLVGSATFARADGDARPPATASPSAPSALPAPAPAPGDALAAAAKAKDLATVKKLLAAGVPADARDKDGWAALHWAANAGSLPIVKALLAHKASVDVAGVQDWTPLYVACAFGHLDVVNYLIAHGATVDLVRGGWTPLIALAANSGDVKVAAVLLGHKVAVDAADNEGQTALHHAARNGKAALVKLLIARGAAVAAVDKDGDDPLELAAEAGSVETAAALVAAGADVNLATGDGTALDHATLAKDSAVAAFLVAHGAKVDDSALLVAANQGVVENVAFLLDHGADVGAVTATDQKSAVAVALEAGHADVVKLLLARGASGASALAAAIQDGKAAAVDSLLALGVSADARVDAKSDPPLIVAIRASQPTIAEQLLLHGADPGVVLPDGNMTTALMWAAYFCDDAMIHLLLAHGAAASLAVRGGNGTALDLASSGWTDTMQPCPQSTLDLLR